MVTGKMVNALNRALAVASDLEDADRSVFEEKLTELEGLRKTTRGIISSATAARNETLGYERGNKTFNRGKRLAIGAIDEHVRLLGLTEPALETASNDLKKILALL